jgi:hypothetical protein
MDFRIADTFTDSLARLTGDEQKAVKTTAFDLQLNPANPGFSFHKLDMARTRTSGLPEAATVSADVSLAVFPLDAGHPFIWPDINLSIRRRLIYTWALSPTPLFTPVSCVLA